MPGPRFRLIRACNADQRGALSTFIAAGMVLPMLLLTIFGGSAVLRVAQLQGDIATLRDGALLQVEAAGGVTPATSQKLQARLHALAPRLQAIRVTGTPAPVAWGSPVRLSITAGLQLSGPPWSFIGSSGQTIRLGGTSYGTSNRAPS